MGEKDLEAAVTAAVCPAEMVSILEAMRVDAAAVGISINWQKLLAFIIQRLPELLEIFAVVSPTPVDPAPVGPVIVSAEDVEAKGQLLMKLLALLEKYLPQILPLILST